MSEGFTIHLQSGRTTVALAVVFGLCAGFIFGVCLMLEADRRLFQSQIEAGFIARGDKIYRLTEFHP